MSRSTAAAALACAIMVLAGSVADAKPQRQQKGVSLKGIVSSELLAKTREIIADCGSVVVSARAGRGYRSNHPIGRAVDLRGNPSCIYARLKDWPGGVSTDYASAPGGPHVHVSYNPHGQEWGLRFRHNHARHSHPSTYAGAVVTDRLTPQ